MPESKLQRVRAVRLSDQAFDQIRTRIMEGEFRPGQKLPSESQLTASLKVSRSSVREALRALESKGLIQVRSGVGAFVSEHPFAFGATGEAMEWLLKRKESLDQMLQVREVLEGLAASLLAAHVSKETVAELQAILRKQHEVQDSPTFVEQESLLDIQFHQTLAAASGNQMIADVIPSLVSTFSSSNRAVLYISGKMETSLREHEQIVQALVASDPAAAEAAMRAHIRRVRAQILSVPENH